MEPVSQKIKASFDATDEVLLPMVKPRTEGGGHMHDLPDGRAQLPAGRGQDDEVIHVADVASFVFLHPARHCLVDRVEVDRAQEGREAAARHHSVAGSARIGRLQIGADQPTKPVTDTLERALEASGCDQATVGHKPRLLSDNGSSYIAGDLADWLDERDMRHTRGAPYHPQTQGKIERWHQTLKNRILLENYYLPGDLEAQIEAFVAHYNHQRYHESLNNLTPADVYFGRGQTILLEREKIKRRTIEHRRLQHRKSAA